MSHRSGWDVGAGGTVTATRDHVLTAANIAAGRLQAVQLEATAANGAKQVSATLTGGETVLDLQPARPETVLALTVQDLEEQFPPFDLGTAEKYRNGQKVVLNGLEDGQWYYVYLNKHSHRLGWIFPTTDITVEFILPARRPERTRRRSGPQPGRQAGLLRQAAGDPEGITCQRSRRTAWTGTVGGPRRPFSS